MDHYADLKFWPSSGRPDETHEFATKADAVEFVQDQLAARSPIRKAIVRDELGRQLYSYLEPVGPVPMAVRVTC